VNADPKQWSPREAAALQELERLREVYLPGAFRETVRAGSVGCVQPIVLPDGQVTYGRIVMIVGSLFPIIFWWLESGRLALTKSSMLEIGDAWKRLGKGRPWGEGLDLLVLG